MKHDGFCYAAIYETRLLENDELVVEASPVRIQVITGPGYIYRLSQDRAVVPLRGILDEEVTIPPPPPIDFEDGKQYIIVSTLTRKASLQAEEESRRIVIRIASLAGLLSSPRIFALPLYMGWVSPTPSAVIHSTVMFSPPEKLARKPLEKGIQVARSVLAGSAELRDKFDLVARLYSRTIGVPPSDEAYLWAWMCLEVFPMLGTQKYRLIAPYLATIVQKDEKYLADTLDIKGLHALRSKLVHAGYLGISGKDLFENLGRVQDIVLTVLRGMCGLPYDGKLDRHLQGAPV